MSNKIISMTQAALEAAGERARTQAEKEIEPIIKAMQGMSPESLEFFLLAAHNVETAVIEAGADFSDVFKIAYFTRYVYADMREASAKSRASLEIQGERARRRREDLKRQEADRHRAEAAARAAARVDPDDQTGKRRI